MSGYCEQCGNTICICDEVANDFNPDWMCTCGDLTVLGVVHRKDAPCYYPDQREWVGLTDEEIDHTKWIPKRGSQITYDRGWLDNMRIFARAVEAKLKEKNT